MFVGVLVGVELAVLVGVPVGVAVLMGVAVLVGVAVPVAVGVAVPVGVAVAVLVGVLVTVLEVVKCHNALMVVLVPSLTVAYHSYRVSCPRLLHVVVTSDPDVTPVNEASSTVV